MRFPSVVMAVLLVLAGIAAPPAAAGAASTAASPDDPLLDLQHGLVLHRVPEAWQTTTGGGVTVAVIDSGVDLDHPDLAANVVQGTSFVGCPDEPDGCGTGDWQDGPDITGPGEGSDHGTHVAGIIAAAADNGAGIAGVAPHATILPVRVLDKNGDGTATLAAQAIIWAVDAGADVVNLSLGGLEVAQWAFAFYREALDYAAAHDVVVVAAAGNSSRPVCASPAFDEGALCVVAVDKRGQHTGYSNLGVEPELNVVAGAGGGLASLGRVAHRGLCDEDVMSTVPPGTASVVTGDVCTGDASLAYDGKAGTSMATPHVAGVAALLRSVGCTAGQTSALLRETAVGPGGAVRGSWTPSHGHGIVDAAAAVQAAGTTCAGTVTGRPLGERPCLQDVAVDVTAGVPDGWTRDAADNPSQTATWRSVTDELGRPALASATGGSGRKDDRLVSPTLLVGERSRLRFAHRFAFEDTSRHPAEHDGGVLEISVDGGDFEAVPPEAFVRGGYTGALLPPGGSGLDETDTPAAGSPAWIMQSGDWLAPADLVLVPLVQDLDLSRWADREVRLRWRVSQGSRRGTVEVATTPGIEWWLHGIELLNLPVTGCSA